MDVAEWLLSLGLERYKEAFRKNDVSDALLPHLTAEDLKEIGVTSVGHRRQLLEAIAELRSPAISAGNAQRLQADWDPTTKAMAERRQLSVMFCDVVGSTALSTRLDPEDLGAVIQGYQSRVSAIIDQFGGFIANYVGDGVLIYFGWPEAHEANAERAVRAALGIADAMSQGPIRSEPLQVRIGIATGLVVVGEPIGSGEARQLTAMGETPNLAARLQALAAPNGIIIDAVTRRQVGGLFDCQDLGSFALKGIPQPVPVWQVLGEAAVEGRFQALHADSRTPLVGREEELEALFRRWRQAKTGEGHLVLLSGEAGIGKSRLIAAVDDQLRDDPHDTLRYFCSPYHQDSALYPVVTRWERDLGFVRGETPQQRLSKVEAALAVYETSPEDLGLIAELLSVPRDDRYPTFEGSSRQKKEKTFEALLRGLTSRAHRQPVLMLFEDAHWIDASSLELLDKVINLLSGLPILLIISFRPEFPPPWIGLAVSTLITLRRLTMKQATQLAKNVVVEQTLPVALLERIVAQTDGVPLFIEELTKTVLANIPQLIESVDTLEVPATLQASLIARLDKLPASKQIAQIGAVIGRSFTHTLLASVANISTTQLAQGIDALVASGLAFRRGALPDTVYSFKHALVRDAVYNTLLRRQRKELHARIGKVLQEQFADISETEPELLAHHFGQAELVDDAVRYWHLAGERALQRSANAEASAHLTRAIGALSSLPPSLERDHVELTLQMALGTAARAMTGHASDESLRVYTRARELLDTSVAIREQMSVLYGLWSVNVVRSEHVAALDVAKQSLSLAGHDADCEAVAFANRMMGFSLWVTGEAAVGTPYLKKVVALFAPGGGNVTDLRYSQDHAVWALTALALTYWHQGYPEKSMPAAKQAFLTCPDSSDHG